MHVCNTMNRQWNPANHDFMRMGSISNLDFTHQYEINHALLSNHVFTPNRDFFWTAISFKYGSNFRSSQTKSNW